MRDSNTSAPDGPARMTTSPSIGATENTSGRDLSGVARALLLGRRLGVRVVIDATGWLSDHVEVVYKREPGNAIKPILVRVGRDARDEDVLSSDSVVQTCRRYNQALSRLQGLSLRLSLLMRERRNAASASSLVHSAFRELSALNKVTAQRQAQYMGNGVVRLAVLAKEIAVLESRYAELAQIVADAERAASKVWEGDTIEMSPED